MGNSELQNIGEGYSAEELYAYKSLFKTRSKPASHYQALGGAHKSRDCCKLSGTNKISSLRSQATAERSSLCYNFEWEW